MKATHRRHRIAAPLAGFCLAAALASCSVKAPGPEDQAPEHAEDIRPESTWMPEEPAWEEDTPVSVTAPLPFLRADGTRIVDEEGRPVLLRGCNLGNWFLLEMWMWDIRDIRDQHEFEHILIQRFGHGEKDRLLDIFRDHWIRPRDFEIIRSFGFNCVRLPFHYSLLEDDARPFELKPDAFRRLDAAVEMARQHRLHVILDLHGVPGGQSDDHTTGRAGQNRLWKVGEYRRRTVWLWGAIARHYREEKTIAAYDLINEPFGAKTAAERRMHGELVDDIYQAIRGADDPHLIFAPATLNGFRFYGAPADRGWENVGFTDHFYPGLFGQAPTPEMHAHFISRRLPAVERYLKEIHAPFLVGEFNVVFRGAGGPALMRHYFDLFAERGWAATMWCYKLLKREGGISADPWALVANKEPLPDVRIREAGLPEIEDYFRWMGGMKYDYHSQLGAAMAMEQAPPVPHIPHLLEPCLLHPPATEDPTPWKATDINHSLPGGQRAPAANSMNIYAGGDDIWATSDQFRFVWQKVQGDFEIEATIRSLDETHIHAKAGLMIRHALDSDSAHLLLHVFPNAEVLTGWRPEDGAVMEQKKLSDGRFPIRLRLRRERNWLEAAYTAPGEPERIKTFRLSDALNGEVYVGLAVLSHDNHCLTTAAFEHIRLEKKRAW